MPAQIRPNRLEVNDRFPMLGFTIRTDGSPQRAEVALGTDLTLFRSENKAKRTNANFYSSRAAAPLSVPRGEAIYVVPPQVLARLIGADRLYFALATAPESKGTSLHVEVMPNEGSPYISLKGLTQRSLRRVRLLPSRQQRAAGYGGNGAAGLEWAGDVVAPGMQPAGKSAAPADRQTPAAVSPAPAANSAADDHVYNDGFGPLPPPPASGSGGTTPAQVSKAQSYYGQATSARPLSQDAFAGDDYGIEGPIPDTETRDAFSGARTLDAPQPEYPGASRFAPAHPSNYHVATQARTIDRIVIHITDGGNKIIGTIGWFQNPDQRNSRDQPIHVSAHYIVGQDGEVVQMVHNNDIAHHASQANSRSIGIEHVARSSAIKGVGPRLTPSEAEYQASAALVAWLCAQFGIAIDREHIVGHSEISPRDHHDDCPNSVWDWDHYMDLVSAAAASANSQAQALAARAWSRAQDAQDDLKDAVTQIAASSDIARYPWEDRGAAPAGYIKGMALVYASVYSKLKAGDAAALEMAKAKTADPGRDALTWYDDIFAAAGMSNDTAGVDTLRHLFVLLIGLGMRESSGKYCEGRDRSAKNTTAETAEAGLFQTSFNARTASPLLPTLFAQYSANPSGFLDIFQEGVQCFAKDLENFGSGDGREFQRLSKECPAFAAEFAAVALRNIRTHWGPINRKKAEVRPACDAMLRQVEACVDASAISEGLSAHAQGMFDLLPVERAAPRAWSRAQESASFSEKFTWPAGLAEPNYLVKAFIEAYNARIDGGVDTRASTLRIYIPPLTQALQPNGGRQYVSDAILMVTIAVSMQVLDEIKDRLPQTLNSPFSTGPSDPLPELSPDFKLPRVLPYLSRRIGMFMAWVDVAIQQATADEAERIAFQKEQWAMMGQSAGMLSTLAGMLPGLGTAATIIGIAVQGIINSSTPNFDQQYTSFAAAMRGVRQTYKALAATILKGLISNQIGGLGGKEFIGIPLHPDVQSYLDAHTANALLGWENELALLGFVESGAAPATSQARALAAPRRAWSRAQEIITPFYDPKDPSSALSCQNDAFSLAREEWFMGVPNTRIFPHSAICQLIMTANGGGSVGSGFYIGPNRILTCAHNLYGNARVTIIPGKNGGDEPFGRCTLDASSWRVSNRYPSDGSNFDLAVIDNVPIAAPGGQWFEFLNATPSDRLPVVVCGYSRKSDVVPELTSLMDGDKQHLHGGYVTQQSTPEVIEYPILTLHRASGSPVYHIDGDGAQLRALVCGVHVSGEPAAQGLNRGCFITPNKIDWIEGRAAALALGARPMAKPVPVHRPMGAKHRLPAAALANESFAVHWNTVPYYPQTSGASCWAASAAMVVGWRDDRVVTDGEIAAKVPVFNAYKTGLFPTDRKALADAWNLIPEPPASYTIDAWRDMLRYNGPLYMDMTWDTSGKGGHARVLVGMESDGAPDGSDTTMYMHDPWPGTPGKIKLSFADFLALYEGRVGNEGGQLQYQILHADGVPAGRQTVIAAPFALTTAEVATPAAERPDGHSRPARLPPPPRARTLEATGIPPAQPARRRVRGGTVEVSWELDQYDEIKTPASMMTTVSPIRKAGPTINLSDWPYIDGRHGRTYAAPAIDWSYKSGGVGDVQVSVPHSMANDGYRLKVTAGIANGPDTATVAAIRVVVRYEFSRAGEPTQIAVTEVTLYGDGRYERWNHDWQQSVEANAA